MFGQYHKLIYAEDILRINAANRDFSPDLHTQIPSNNVHSPGDINSKARPSPRLYGVALPAGTKEVSRTETSREVIFDTVRRGFAAAFDSLVLDPAERVGVYSALHIHS
ncbi:hypothetical protein EON65_05085 [archaeon]|nr:MAG: hypothetical protein EON65_05085 [archaeon]